MVVVFVSPYNVFQNLLSLLSENPEREIYLPVGIHRDGEDVTILARRGNPIFTEKDFFVRYLKVSLTSEPLGLSDWVSSGLEVKGCGQLVLGREVSRGDWWGCTLAPSGDLVPIQELRLIGAEMPTLTMSPLGDGPVSQEQAPIELPHFQRWSRTIGALGLQTWDRLTDLSFSIIGCGRSGSSAAVSLVKGGVKTMRLFDGDKIEPHNLPEMDGVTERDIGRFKVEALAAYLKEYCASSFWPVNISAHPAEMVSIYREALKSDVLICCVDNDRARLACGILSTLFHRVLLDIGTGIFGDRESSGQTPSTPRVSRQMGGDIRLIVPGHGCLRCFGGLANYNRAVSELSRQSKPIDEPWWVQRRGSLRTLNMTTVHLGLQLLLDFVEGRIEESQWLNLTWGDKGELRLEEKRMRDFTDDCPLCSKAGMGDDGLHWD